MRKSLELLSLALQLSKGGKVMLQRCQAALVQIAILIIILLGAGGCATVKHMALDEDAKDINLTQESLVLMTLKTSNHYKSIQPAVDSIVVWSQEGKKFNFMPHKIHVELASKAEDLLISMGLPPGRYMIRDIVCGGRLFPISGICYVPLFDDFVVDTNQIIYIGSIDAVLRERRNDNELRAGPGIPFIDQKVTGFYGGTFDITIADNYDNDIPRFKKRFPVLQKYEISKAILPPWKKPSAEVIRQDSSLPWGEPPEENRAKNYIH